MSGPRAMSKLSQRHSTKRTVSNNPPIANEINTATRSLHTELNRLIIDRLPLALPPSASSPSRYATGLRRFALLFVVFESAFQAVIKQASKTADQNVDGDHQQAVLKWVAGLVPSKLFRTARLQADLEHLQLLKHDGVQSVYGAETLSKLTVNAIDKPHILVAYAWVMYMAIFSGGRWIRSELNSAGPGFWLGIEEAAGLHIDALPGFTFLSFDDQSDGEDLKAHFKTRLEAADDLLTAEERQEVIETGVDVFKQCIRLVEQIDRDVWWNESVSWQLALAVLLLGLGYIGWLLYTGQSLFPKS